MLLAVVALAAYFRAVRTEWPASYFPIGRRLETELSQSAVRFSLYRFSPVTVCAALAGATLARDGRQVAVPALAIGLLHGLLTSGRGVWRAYRDLDGPISVTRGLAHGSIAVGCVVAAAVGIPLANALADFVPTADEFVAAMWTAGLAALAGAWVLSLTRDEDDREAVRERAFRRSRKTIGDTVWNHAADVAREVNADPRLVHSVLIVENVQRPRWLRPLESLAGRWTSSGTYGPLQVRAGRASYDETALVERAIRQRFAGQRFLNTSGHVDETWLELFLDRYNGDRQWRSDAQAAYRWLEYGNSTAMASSSSTAADGLPLIEVNEVEDHGRTVSIAGTSLVRGPGIVFSQWSDSTGEIERCVLPGVGERAHRETWTVNMLRELAATVVIVRELKEVEELLLDAGTARNSLTAGRERHLIRLDPIAALTPWLNGESDWFAPHPVLDPRDDRTLDYIAIPLSQRETP